MRFWNVVSNKYINSFLFSVKSWELFAFQVRPLTFSSEGTLRLEMGRRSTVHTLSRRMGLHHQEPTHPMTLSIPIWECSQHLSKTARSEQVSRRHLSFQPGCSNKASCQSRYPKTHRSQFLAHLLHHELSQKLFAS